MPSPDNLKGRCAYLMNVYVREEFRRKGIARKLCTKLIEIAKNRHVEKVYLESSDMGKPLYKSLGFKDMCGYMKL
jgi:ribosomal protein S18 acetylase RimI-like enzyme